MMHTQLRRMISIRRLTLGWALVVAFATSSGGCFDPQPDPPDGLADGEGGSGTFGGNSAHGGSSAGLGGSGGENAFFFAA